MLEFYRIYPLQAHFEDLYFEDETKNNPLLTGKLLKWGQLYYDQIPQDMLFFKDLGSNLNCKNLNFQMDKMKND